MMTMVMMMVNLGLLKVEETWFSFFGRNIAWLYRDPLPPHVSLVFTH